MSKKEHNILADTSFREAEGHANAGRHKNLWHSLGQAQTHATNHAKGLAEGGKHGAALAYRKMTMARVGDISRKLGAKVAKSVTEFQMSKYSALAAIWEEMKKNGAGRLKFAIPQVELAKTSEEVDALLAKYGITLNREVIMAKGGMDDRMKAYHNHAASSPFKNSHQLHEINYVSHDHPLHIQQAKVKEMAAEADQTGLGFHTSEEADAKGKKITVMSTWHPKGPEIK